MYAPPVVSPSRWAVTAADGATQRNSTKTIGPHLSFALRLTQRQALLRGKSHRHQEERDDADKELMTEATTTLTRTATHWVLDTYTLIDAPVANAVNAIASI